MPYSLIKAKHVSIRRAGAQPLGSPWDVLRFVLMTEKSVKVIEGENVIVFVAYKSANKFIISQAFEKAFGQKVAHVRTLIDQDGRKKAFVKLKEPGAASDVAIKLGVI
jgi:ribosomal protein L23